MLAGCGGSPPGQDETQPDASAPGQGSPDAGGGALADAALPGTLPPVTDEALATTAGCAGVFNPDQVLDYHLELADGDWSALLADQTNSVYYPSQLRCGDGPAITVGLRRKRSGGAVKVGLKIDMNHFISGQTYYGLKKLSMENGVSEGTTVDGADVATHLTEYLAWRMMVRSGAISGRAAFARIYINGELLGVYVNVEQVDKRFLSSRLGDSSGWLYKHSGGAGDGFKTHETDGLDDPYDDYFCFWESGKTCTAPTADALAQELPALLDIDQMLRMGAVNALIANTDSPLFKDNNYYWYDWSGGRVYIPWDLDTIMSSHFDVFVGGGIGGQTSKYTDVLFTHWEDDYDAILTELLAGALSLEAIQSELERARTVAAEAFASDPYVTGTLDDAVSQLDAYWTQRHAEVQAQVDAH